MSDHEWCRDVRRDEAVRAAEDAAAVPAIQHRDLPEAVAALTERVARLEGAVMPKSVSASDAEGLEKKCDTMPDAFLRTERVTIEVTHNCMYPAAEWILEEVQAACCDPGESARVVEADEIARLTAERDAAIRERDAALSAAGITHGVFPELYELRAERERLRGRVAELERAYSAECDARVQAHRELSDLASAVRERESGEECDHSYAAQCREAAAARDRADRMMPAPAANAGVEDNSEPVAWGVLMTPGSKVWRCSSEKQAQKCVDHFGTGTVVPLYAAPQPPRGWLTAEERALIEYLRATFEQNADAWRPHGLGGHVDNQERRVRLLDALLARETPPRVKVPKYFPMSWAHERDAAWIAAIRAAGGEVEG